MPTIPRGADINRRVPSTQQQIVRTDTSSAGAGMAMIAGVMKEVQDDRSRYQLAQAKTQFLSAKVKQDNAYHDDEDYGTIPDRYEHGMREAMESASHLIDDRRVRDMFMDDAGLETLRGYERIKVHARGVETDYQRAFVDNGLTELRETAIDGNMASTLQAARELVDSAVAMNYLSAEEAEAQLSAWRDDTLVAKIETMPPEQRIEALDEEWAQSIPTDLRTRLRRQADDLLLDGNAMAKTDELLFSGRSEEEMRGDINAIPDPRLRAAVEQRWNAEIQRDRTMDAEKQNDYVNQYYAAIRAPQTDPTKVFTVDMIPQDIRDQFSADTYKTLREAGQQSRAMVPTRTNTDVLRKLHDMHTMAKSNGDYTPIREYYDSVVGQLSMSDVDTWGEVASLGQEGLPVEVTSELNDNQYVVRRLSDELGNVTGTGSNKKNRSDLEDALIIQWDEYRRTYQETHNGIPPDEAQREAWVDVRVMEYTFPVEDGGFAWFDSVDTERFIDMNDQQKDAFMLKVNEMDPGKFTEALRILGAPSLNDLDPTQYEDLLDLVAVPER